MQHNDKNKRALNFVELEMGKMPPQAIDLEESVLGAIMLEKEALEETFDTLSDDLFYKEAHRITFEAIKALVNKKAPVDISTVCDELKRAEKLESIGGAHFIMSLTNKIASSANIKYHITVLTEQAIRRKQILHASETIERSYDLGTDVFDNLSQDAISLSKVEEMVSGDIGDYDMTNSIRRTVKFLMTPRKNEYPGIPTGNSTLSSDIGGFQPGDLIYLGARPSEGKTDRMLNFACNLAENDIPVAVFSLETMREHKINIRLLSRYSGVDNTIVYSGKWTHDQMDRISAAEVRIASLPLYIFDDGMITPNKFRSILRKMKRDHDVRMAFGDYIQLVTPDNKAKNGTREQELSQISRSMKLTAKELEIPIMWLAQLNRAIEGRQGLHRRPRLSDFRETGSLEQDGDVVMTIFGLQKNEIPFDQWCNDNTFDGKYYPFITELSLLKNKNGPAGKILVEYYHKQTSRYMTSPDDYILLPEAQMAF